MKFSRRIEQLPPYLFAEIDRKKKAAHRPRRRYHFARRGRSRPADASLHRQGRTGSPGESGQPSIPLRRRPPEFPSGDCRLYEKALSRRARPRVGDLFPDRFERRAGASSARFREPGRRRVWSRIRRTRCIRTRRFLPAGSPISCRSRKSADFSRTLQAIPARGPG